MGLRKVTICSPGVLAFLITFLVGISGARPDSSSAVQEGIDLEGTNRFPLILSDAKTLFAEAVIADHHGDTLEVLYLIDKIVELMTEAEQLGEMSDDDRMEYDRFEKTLLYTYEHHFRTVDKIETPISTASLKEQLSEYLEPIEFEINGSKFRVIDDREGHIPLVMNKRVEQAIEFFQTKGRRNFETWLSRYAVYSDLIVDILKKNDLPEELVFHSMVESGLNPKAYSRAHAAGLWQFVSSTAKRYGLSRTWWIDERRDPVKSTEAAAEYMKDLFIEFDDWYLALAAYNAGTGRVNRAVKLHQTRDFWRLSSLPKETRNHVPAFLAAAIITRNPDAYGFQIPPGDPLVFDEVVLDNSADLSVIATSAGISVDRLKQLNPELRQFATPPGQPYTVRLPRGTANAFTTAFSALPDDQRFAPQYLVHRVRKGETLSLIAQKYRVSIHNIASINKIRNYHRLQIGQKLTIPVPSLTRSGSLAASSRSGDQRTTVHVVKKGDTLGHIAVRYGTSARTLRQWNGLRYGEYIYPGQKLLIPVQSVRNPGGGGESVVKEIYTVQKGDTLSDIAARYGTSVTKITTWNRLTRGEVIFPGQKLVIYVNEG
ncbi:MAG: LysM peptidoglycan-binding domain-containing protein [Fidelibacterota bacterium]